MTSVRIAACGYGHFADVFTPRGLPLVAKSPGGEPTTSVLIRGAAGTGKTTLAVAIAHAVARQLDGVVLYIATEAALSDVRAKITLLGLGESELADIDDKKGFSAGSIAVTHTALRREEALTAGPGQLAHLVIELASELVGIQRPGAPIRAVVIDSFELPEGADAGDSARPGRSELVAFVQSLEDTGVTPVLVEELGSTTSDRLTFVVDVVMSLALEREAQAGAYRRELVVSKCRYGEGHPGPHTMTLQAGRPAVWPQVPQMHFARTANPSGFLFVQSPAKQPAQFISLSRGALVLSCYSTDRLRVLRAFGAVPGVAALSVQCGSQITIHGPDGATTTPASAGPLALSWSVCDVLARASAGGAAFNALVFYRLEHLLADPRFARAIPELLYRLVQVGLLVCVHGPREGLLAVDPIADYSGPSGHYLVSDIAGPLERQHRWSTLWTKGVPGIGAAPIEDRSRYEVALAAVNEAERALTDGDLDAAKPHLSFGTAAVPCAAARRELVRAALQLHRFGMTGQAGELLAHLRKESASRADQPTRAAVAWAYAEIGLDIEAAATALDGIDQPDPHAAHLRLWHVTHMRYTTVAARLDKTAWSEPLTARYAAAAAARRGTFPAAAEILTLAAQRLGLPDSRRDRLLADAMLEASEPRFLLQARTEYEKLQKTATNPIDRADIAFNLGVVAERQTEPERALEHYRRALEANPNLAVADARIRTLTDA